MKKKRIWIPVGIVGILLAACIGFVALCGTVGTCIAAKNGSYLIAMGNSPVRMTDQMPGDAPFEGLRTGDRILILHDGVNESYPGSTGVYFLVKLPGGSEEDIPGQMLEKLSELGWID